MKSTLLPFLVLIFLSLSSLAQIPNNDFELWSPMGTYQSPDNWDNLNQITYNSNIYTCTEGSPGYSGASFLYLMTKAVPGKGIVPGIAVCGIVDTLTYKAKSGFPYSSRPQGLSYYMQYMPSDPSDSSSVNVILTKWNLVLSKRDTIAEGATYFNGMYHTWVSRTTPLTYYSGNSPDSAMIVVASSDNTPFEFSYIYLDNLQFIGTVASIDQYPNTANLFIFPNPANESINITLEDEYNAMNELIIHDCLGKMIFNSAFYESQIIELSEWDKGMYFLSIKSNKGAYNRKFIVN